MLISGFLGEAGHAPEMPMLIIGCLAWFYIMYEVWAGDAKKGTTPPQKELSSLSALWQLS